MPLHTLLKITLSALLFLCLANMPYGYYQFVRLAALLGFAFLAYESHKDGRQTETFVYAGLALLFQPMFKIALGRTLWNVVDVLVGIGLLLTVLKPNVEEKKS